MDAAPLERTGDELETNNSAGPATIAQSLLDELWHKCRASEWGLERDAFDRILVVAGMSQNFGLSSATVASPRQQEEFFRGIKLADLVLAKACAAGHERAWEHFLELYSQPLTRAAVAISGNETVGRDLVDAFYAELYGLTVRDGERRCPLASYRGRGSLLGWLRTTLAQRHVDHYRRTRREEPLEDSAGREPAAMPASQAPSPLLATAVEHALREQDVEERFLLAAYYLDERTLAQIATVLRVHEATVSRRLRRATDAVRKQVMRNLEKLGMSRRAVEEALGTDPRDVDLKIDLKKLLQSPRLEAFPEGASKERLPEGESTGQELTSKSKAAG